MKIFMINDAMKRGGKERRLIELLKGLKKYPDVEVELLLLSSHIDYPEVHEVCDTVHILERRTQKDLSVFARLFKVIKQRKPDIIHSWGSLPSTYAIPSVIFQDVRFFNAMITNANPSMKWNHPDKFRGMITFPFSDIVVANSKAGLKVYHAPPAKAHCLYNGFDFNRIANLRDPLEVRQQYNIQTERVVGMVGAFMARKDYRTYLEAAIQMAGQRKDVTFLAVGGGELLPESQAMVPPALQDRILFPGMVKQVESLVNVFDIGVLASNEKVHGEGISNSILEYMALSKPVVATQGGGTPEIIEEGKTGYMVPPFDPIAMAERIQDLLDHRERAQTMGQAGYLRVKTHFNLQDMASRYYELYTQLLPQPHLSPSNGRPI